MGRVNELTPTEMPHKEQNELNPMLFKCLGEAQMDVVKEMGQRTRSKGAKSVCVCVCVRTCACAQGCVPPALFDHRRRRTGPSFRMAASGAASLMLSASTILTAMAQAVISFLVSNDFLKSSFIEMISIQ